MTQNRHARRASVAILVIAAAGLLPCSAGAHEPRRGNERDPALAARLHARVYTDDEGLPQNSVEALALSPGGTLWATTREGGASFDGSRWVPVEMPANAPSNWPRTLLAAEDGAIWFATEGGGLYRLAGDRWSSVTTSRISTETVGALAETKTASGAHIIWAGSAAGLHLSLIHI